MNDLKEIGFYTLSDERAKNASCTSQMKRCEMIITEYCNFHCPYCRGLSDYIYGERKIKQLSFEEIKKNIDYWCEGQPLENIRFSGGEPTLHKNIVEIVEYAKAKGIKRIAISTNGSNKFELYKRLIEAGCNDFSISLDACCSSEGDKMAGGVYGAWEKVVANIAEISKLTYVTVGVVLTETNIQKVADIIDYADKLGVSDIRIITAAQWNETIELDNVSKDILDKHPILKYRLENIKNGKNVRGIGDTDSHKCGLVLDDSVIAGSYHFPCVIYMREKGAPIGKVGPNMRQERLDYYKKHNSFEDPICKKNCLDVCVFFNNKFASYHKEDDSKNQSE
jgi:molybdenum cofactor biosynthesis enzyme MoaA